MWIICMQQQHNIMLTHVDIMFTFFMADLRPIGSQISGLQFEGSQLTGIYLERVPFDGSHSAEKKQVDIDGLKSTVSSRKKEAFGSTLQSLQLCFDSGPMAVSSIIGHVGGIHVEVHFENLRCQCIEYVVQKTEPYWAIARVQSCFSACTYEWLAQDLL